MRHNYLPALHRQATQKLDENRSRDELKLTLNKLSLDDKSRAFETARDVFSETVMHLLPYTKKNKYGLNLNGDPLFAGEIPPWTPYNDDTPAYLCPIGVGNIEPECREPGYFVFPIPERTGTSLTVRKLEVRSEDGENLSPKKMYENLYKVFDDGILKFKKDFETDEPLEEDIGVVIPEVTLYENNDIYSLVLSFPRKGTYAEIIPTIAETKTGPFYVAKPFENDTDPGSDCKWRINFLTNEMSILKTVSSGDNEQRRNAVKILNELCRLEWKLKPVTPYHVKMVLLHEMDFQVDHSPRWQRFTLEHCFTLLMRKLLDFVKLGRLPHFFEEELNLWAHLSKSQIHFMGQFLESLLEDESKLQRILRRLRSKHVDLKNLLTENTEL